MNGYDSSILFCMGFDIVIQMDFAKLFIATPTTVMSGIAEDMNFVRVLLHASQIL